MDAAQALLLMRALADPIRLRVIEALAGGERCVCELTADLVLAQSKLSFHLRVLRQAGLIAARQQGRWIYYRLQLEALAELQAWIHRLATSAGQGHRGCAEALEPLPHLSIARPMAAHVDVMAQPDVYPPLTS